MFYASFQIIAKHYLSNCYKEKIFDKDFCYIYDKFISLLDDDDDPNEIPKDEDNFYQFVIKECIGLIDEPRIKLLELFLEASEDLVEIQNNISQIINQKIEINNIKQRNVKYLSQDDRYEIHKLDYYLSKNTNAKEEIIDFLTHKIKQHSYQKCLSIIKHLNPFLQTPPYNFSRRNIFRNKEDCNITNFSIYFNKFLRLPIRQYEKNIIENIDTPENIILFAKKYIIDYNILSDLKNLISSNHILHRRQKELLQTILNYEKNDFVSFNLMTPLQIEGIFHDLCVEVGVEEKDLELSSLNEKLLRLKNENHFYMLYEYYAFHFPKIRNNVAHGKLFLNEHDDQAVLLLLDLVPVCEMTTYDSLPINKSLALINNIFKNSLESLFEWIEFIDYEHPSFYQLEDKIQLIKNKYDENFFNEYIDTKINSGIVDDIKDVKIKITKLKKNGICHKNCESTLKKINAILK